ncbi:MAG: hypothetical protein KF799_09045 [Bdellovibrionales bacterium]|nr:hypothetical protein [Bdellovibrionales bacterium]
MSKILLLFAALVIGPAVLAAPSESTSTLNADELTETTSKPDGQDVDTLITNKKLRTDTGSKSRYSISTSLNYAGGSLQQPFGEKRPNITGALGTTDFPALGGSISGKYNLTTQQALFAGFGLRWVAPLSGTRTPNGYQGDRVDVENPYFAYQYIYNLFGLQSAVSLRQTYVSASDQQRKGFLTNWGFGQTSVYEFEGTGFSIGFNTYIGAAVFTKHDPEFKKEQGDYSWAFLPAIEYRLTDKVNLRMDSNLFVFEHIRSSENPWTFRRYDVSQNFGVGISVTRDIYLSPGVSFVIGDLRADRTTWSIGSSANLF